KKVPAFRSNPRCSSRRKDTRGRSFFERERSHRAIRTTFCGKHGISSTNHDTSSPGRQKKRRAAGCCSREEGTCMSTLLSKPYQTVRTMKNRPILQVFCGLGSPLARLLRRVLRRKLPGTRRAGWSYRL